MGLRQAVGGTFVGAGNGFAAPVDGTLLGTMLVTIEGVVAGRISLSPGRAIDSLSPERAIRSILVDETQDRTTDSMTGIRSKMPWDSSKQTKKVTGNDWEQLIKGIENDAEREKAKAQSINSV